MIPQLERLRLRLRLRLWLLRRLADTCCVLLLLF